MNLPLTQEYCSCRWPQRNCGHGGSVRVLPTHVDHRDGAVPAVLVLVPIIIHAGAVVLHHRDHRGHPGPQAPQVQCCVPVQEGHVCVCQACG